jgi:hypothetical protein
MRFFISLMTLTALTTMPLLFLNKIPPLILIYFLIVIPVYEELLKTGCYVFVKWKPFNCLVLAIYYSVLEIFIKISTVKEINLISAIEWFGGISPCVLHPFLVIVAMNCKNKNLSNLETILVTIVLHYVYNGLRFMLLPLYPVYLFLDTSFIIATTAVIVQKSRVKSPSRLD